MRKIILGILISLNFIRCFPHLIIFLLHPDRRIIKSDIIVWVKEMGKTYKTTIGLIYLLALFPEFRTLFYYRIGNLKYILNIFCRKLPNLDIDVKELGEGFFINHGYSTIIGAKSIGKNCRVGPQVTIGENFGKRPTLLDNVRIRSGAIILGGITIGNNSNIGANATVLKDVPDNCTVYPSLPIIMKWKKETNPENEMPENYD